MPKLASLILRHDLDGEVKGIEAFAPATPGAEQLAPPVAPLFFGFRLMLALGMAMLALSWLGAWLLRRGAAPPKWLLWSFAAFTFSGWVATLSGWLVTEIGRQPWLVTGILKTSQAVGRIPEAQLGASLTGYVLVYALMLAAYMVVITHLAGKGTSVQEKGP